MAEITIEEPGAQEAAQLAAEACDNATGPLLISCVATLNHRETPCTG